MTADSRRRAQRRRRLRLLALTSCALLASGVFATDLAEQNERLLAQIRQLHGLDDTQVEGLRSIFARAGFVGQGNPAISSHPLSEEECKARRAAAGLVERNPSFEAICGGPFLAPLYDPRSEAAGESRVCIDQFEFPDIPCAYPVVWVRAREAAEICTVLGKRICDAHEWEGACAGRLEPPDYRFDLAQGVDPATAVNRMRKEHNRYHDAHKIWSYGTEYRTGICAAASHKTDGCEGGGWSRCGSNTYPVGSFPQCRSDFAVYDLHGNAAEHMNLPLDPSEMASRGSTELGYTEMKGSWFIFDHYRAHEDACRWRAPYWHGGRVMDADSHHNYHLGFRCCKDVGEGGQPTAPAAESRAPR